MNFLIKTFVLLISVSASKSCATFNRNNIQKINNKNLSSWVVVVCAGDQCPVSIRSAIHYGSLIHPQAVLTSNEFQLNAKSKNCYAGCPSIADKSMTWTLCQKRSISNTYSRGVNVILILEEPFTINDNTNVIKLVKSKDLILDSNCYFYAVTFNFFNNDSTVESHSDYSDYPSIAGSYKTKFTNGTIGPYLDHNGNFTQVIDSSLGVDEAGMMYKDYCASPIVCQLRDDPSGYGQIGFFRSNQTLENKTNQVVDGVFVYNNFNQTQFSYVNLHGYKKVVVKLQDSYRDITAIRDDIYYTLINHFNLTSIVESLYNNRFYAFKKMDSLK